MIRFSNQDEPQNFKPDLDETSRVLRVSSGTRIVAVARARQETLVFTDMSLHSLQFLEQTRFWAKELETNISIAGQEA